LAVKSKAQRRKFAELLVKGKIKPEVYERWNREAGKKELPERVKKKKKYSTPWLSSAPRATPGRSSCSSTAPRS
jgi:hypothetical protein